MLKQAFLFQELHQFIVQYEVFIQNFLACCFTFTQDLNYLFGGFIALALVVQFWTKEGCLVSFWIFFSSLNGGHLQVLSNKIII